MLHREFAVVDFVGRGMSVGFAREARENMGHDAHVFAMRGHIGIS